MLEDKKLELAVQLYNKFQSEFYLLETDYSDVTINDLEVELTLLEHNCKISK